MGGYIGSKASVTVVSPETDSRYVNVSGDTMTGNLTAPAFIGSGSGLTGVGKVLQVVSSNQTASMSTTSGTFTDIGLSASITPSSASSKVYVVATFILSSQVSNLSVESAVFRGATQLSPIAAHYAAAAGWVATTHSINSLDSPATTSSVTYSVKARVSAGAGTISASNASTITLMEIAG